MHRAIGAGLEPAIAKHLVALDGNQPGADVGRFDLHFDFFARRVVGFAERKLQFGVLVQRARDIARARHHVGDAIQLGVVLITNHISKAAGFIGGEF